MYFLTRIFVITICLTVLPFVSGQTQVNCEKSRHLLNENGDRFFGSWTGTVKGIQIAEKKFGESGKLVETWITLNIDDEGRLLESYLTNDRIPKFGRSAYTYDPNGRITKRTSYNPDGSAVFEDIYTYDSYGNVLTKHTQNVKSKIVIGTRKEFKYESPNIFSEYSDGKLVRRIEVVRDDECRVIKRTLSTEGGKLENLILLKSDIHGNVIENIAYSPSGKPAQKLKWEYEYDDRQNWMKKRSFEWHYWDPTAEYTLVSEELRTITYATPK